MARALPIVASIFARLRTMLGIVQEALDVCWIEARNGIGVEIRECAAESVALGKNGPPGEPCLERLEAQEFEQRTLIGHWKAPFGVVIPLVEGITIAETPPGIAAARDSPAMPAEAWSVRP